MSYSDVETLVGLWANLFGNSAEAANLIGVIIMAVMLVLTILLGIGFEASAVIMVGTAWLLLTAGFLPTWLTLPIFFGMAAALTAMFLKVLNRK